jgi:hypothetical protein
MIDVLIQNSILTQHTAASIAYIFGPLLIRPKVATMETVTKGIKQANSIVEFLIKNKDEVFGLAISAPPSPSVPVSVPSRHSFPEPSSPLPPLLGAQHARRISAANMTVNNNISSSLAPPVIPPIPHAVPIAPSVPPMVCLYFHFKKTPRYFVRHWKFCDYNFGFF